MSKKQVKRPVGANLKTFKEETWDKRAGIRRPLAGGSLEWLDARMAQNKIKT